MQHDICAIAATLVSLLKLADAITTGGLNVEGEADSWDFGVGMYSMPSQIIMLIFGSSIHTDLGLNVKFDHSIMNSWSRGQHISNISLLCIWMQNSDNYIWIVKPLTPVVLG